MSVLKLIKDIIRRQFVSGVLIVVPLILTYVVLRFLFESIDGILQPIVQRTLGYHVPGLGIAITILIIILAGFFTRGYIGARLFRYGDRLLTTPNPGRSHDEQLFERLGIVREQAAAVAG